MCVDPANCDGYCPECQAQKGKQKMTPLEAMARAHWAATCAHYVKSSGIADVMPKFDALDEKVRKEVIDDMRAAVRALMECGSTHGMVNTSRLGMIECCEEFRAMLAAVLEGSE